MGSVNSRGLSRASYHCEFCICHLGRDDLLWLAFCLVANTDVVGYQDESSFEVLDYVYSRFRNRVRKHFVVFMDTGKLTQGFALIVQALLRSFVLSTSWLFWTLQIHCVSCSVLAFLFNLAIHLSSLHQLTSHLPHTDSIAPVFVWSTIEIALGIVAASTATLRPLLRSWKILGFSSDGSSDTEPGGPRSGSWSGFKKTPFGPSNRTATHLSNELSLGDTIHAQSPNLKTVKSWSGKSGHSEERILGEASGRSAGNERGLEGENEEYELVSMPDGRILRRTEIQIEYDERRKNLETDMVWFVYYYLRWNVQYAV